MLNRFIKHFLSRHRCLELGALGVLLTVASHALAAVPSVVVTSTTAYSASSNYGYANKVVVDPFGNVYFTDSSNGALWVVPVGTSTGVRVSNFVLYASVSAAGSGYTSAPTVTFSAPQTAGGVTATATANVSATGTISSITMTNQGSGYTAAPTVSFAGGGGSGAAASAGISLNGTHGFTVDKYGDVIVGNATSGNLYFLPYKNGKLCTACNAAGTEPLDLTGSYGYSALDDYYGIVADVAIDNSGNLYVAMSHCNNNGNACGSSQDSIFVLSNITNATTAATIATAGTAQLFIGALPAGKAILNLTVDNRGHLLYVDGSNAYIVNTTAGSTPTVIGTGFSAPSGISVDASGNVYIVDNSKKLLSVIPNENSTLTPADQFVIAALTNPYYSVGFDSIGNIYAADGNDKVINKIVLGALNLPATAVGAASTAATLGFRFNTAITPGSFAFQQGAGSSTEFTNNTAATTCTTTAYAAGSGCVVSVILRPSSTGTRQGAVVLLSSAGKPLATGFLSGTGTGAGLTVDPGTQTTLTASAAWKSPTAVALDAAGNIYAVDTGVVQVVSAAGVAKGSVGSGLSSPGGVAVDGAGNVFIADTGNSRVVEVPNEAGTLNTADQTVLAFTGLMKPQGIAVDPSGAVYVADTGNARVVRLPTTTPTGSPLQTSLGSGYMLPVAVATDNNGNVYIADQTANLIDEVNVLTGALTVPINKLGAPVGVALDAAGSLYVAQSSGGQVVRIPIVNGILSSANELDLADTVSPTGVAVNGAGFVAIADAGEPSVFTLQRTANTLNFNSVNSQLSSLPLTLTLTSAGTSSVTLGATPYTVTGTGQADFTVTSSATGGCTANQVLALGSICTYSAVFSPVITSGSPSELLTYSSNAVNAGVLSTTLTGTATNLSLTTTTLTQVQPANGANPQYGQVVSVSATVSSQRAGTTPTGSVQFTVDGLEQGYPIPLSTAAPFTATLKMTELTLNVGSHVVNAMYSGDSNNASSKATAALQLLVVQQATSVAVSVTPAVSQTPGSSFTFVGQVNPAIGGSPSGNISLVLAGTTTPLMTIQLSATGIATFVYAPPGSGQYQLIYSGDTNYSSSISSAVAVSIRNTGYDVSVPSATYTVASGQSVVVPITITSISGYSGYVTVTGINLTAQTTTPACSGLPAYTTCTFSPGIVNLAAGGVYPGSNPTAGMNLTIATNVPPAAPYALAGFLSWSGALCAALLAFALRSRRKFTAARLAACGLFFALGGVMLALSGCGQSNAYSTPKGTSTVTLTFSGTPLGGPLSVPSPSNPDISNTATIQLIVQ